MIIGAAKRLKTGRVDGAELIRRSRCHQRRRRRTRAVADKVCASNRAILPGFVYPDGNFNVVTSALALHRIPSDADRAQAIRQMWRVLKPGGRLAIFDVWHTGDYAEELRAAGATQVELSPMSFPVVPALGVA